MRARKLMFDGGAPCACEWDPKDALRPKDALVPLLYLYTRPTVPEVGPR